MVKRSNDRRGGYGCLADPRERREREAMAKKRLTKQEWMAQEAKRRQRTAERNLARWQSRPAQRNYLLLSSCRSLRAGNGPVYNRGVTSLPDTEGDVFWSEVRPDKRAHGEDPIHVSVRVSAGVSPEAIVRHLVKVAGLVVSPLVQRVLQGEPLVEPQAIGYSPNPDASDTPEPWERAHAEQTSAPASSSGTSQEALILTLAETVGYERAVDLLLRAMGDEPTGR
jgi:hypothetical protein